MADISNLLAKIASKIDDEGGRFSIVAEPPSGPAEGRWTAGLEWGEETPGSAMYGGASYGTGDTAEQALAQIAQEVGL